MSQRRERKIWREHAGLGFEPSRIPRNAASWLWKHVAEKQGPVESVLLTRMAVSSAPHCGEELHSLSHRPPKKERFMKVLPPAS